MAFNDIKWAVCQEGLTTHEKLVLILLANHRNKAHGYAYPSVSKLARGGGMCENAVRKCIKSLEARGLIMVERNAGRGGTNRYWILFSPAQDEPLHSVHPCKPSDNPLHHGSPSPAGDADEPEKNQEETEVMIETGAPSYPSKLTKVEEGYVQAVEKGNYTLANHMPDKLAVRMIDEGRLTREQCKRAGKLL